MTKSTTWLSSMNNFDTWFTVLMLVIFTTMVSMATQYPLAAARMPLTVGIPGMLLCLLQLGQNVLYARGAGVTKKFHSAPQAGVPQVLEEEEELPEFGMHTAKDELITWGYFVSLVGGILLFGYIVTIPIIVFVYLVREAGVKFYWAALSAAIYIGVIYFLFVVVLRFWLFQGFWTPQIMRWLGI